MWAVVIGVLGPISACWAGLYYEQESRIRPADKSGSTTVVRLRIFVQSRCIRIERADAGQTVIARLEDGVVWSIDERKGVYYEADLEAVAAGWKRMRRAEGIEEDAATVSVKQGGEKKSIMWHTCDHYVISAGEKAILEVWADKDFDFPEKETIYSFRARMGEFSPAVLREMKKVPGFPLQMSGVTYVGSDRMLSLREIKSIKRKDIDPGKFTLPDGLKKATAGE